MSHGIEEHDIIYTHDKDGSWHGLSKYYEEITEEVVLPILFPIIESPACVTVDGESIELDNHKVLCADFRNCRPDMDGKKIHPLHIPKSSYTVLDNKTVWDIMTKSLKDLGASVATVGTIENCKKFFISCDIGDSEIIINKDKYKFYLNFITSHDGTQSLSAMDGNTRIICKNTMQMAIKEEHTLKFKIYHTKNSDLAVKNLPDLLNAVLKGRLELKELLEFLDTVKIDNNDALAYANGYFAEKTGDIELSSRSMNQATEIANLFSQGISCHGSSLYDLYNGVTQFFTSGNGVGRKNTTDIASRVYKSEFGTASEHKQDFLSMLVSDDRRANALEMGREAIELSLLS